MTYREIIYEKWLVRMEMLLEAFFVVWLFLPAQSLSKQVGTVIVAALLAGCIGRLIWLLLHRDAVRTEPRCVLLRRMRLANWFSGAWLVVILVLGFLLGLSVCR